MINRILVKKEITEKLIEINKLTIEIQELFKLLNEYPERHGYEIDSCMNAKV